MAEQKKKNSEKNTKNTSGFLCETNDFDSMRRMLRAIYMYGSRSTQDMENDGIIIQSKRSMDNYQKRFDLFFNTEDEEWFSFHKHPERKQDKKLMKMRHDRFHLSYNYFAEAYAQHTVSPAEIISFIYLLEAFRFMQQPEVNKPECVLTEQGMEDYISFRDNSLKKARRLPSLNNLYDLAMDIYGMNFQLAVSEKKDKKNDKKNDGKNDEKNDEYVISIEQFRAQLNILHELGYLKRKEEKGMFLYEPVPDIFDVGDETMKDEYLDCLDLLIEFFCDHAPVEIPGHYLREKVMREKNDPAAIDRDYNVKTRNRCFMKNARLQNILDDDAVWTLLSFMHDMKPVCYTYSAKDIYSENKVTVFPIKIVMDRTYGRSYLFGRKYIINKNGSFSRKGEYIFHRTDRIFDINEVTGHGKNECLGFIVRDAEHMPEADIRSRLDMAYENEKANSWAVSSAGGKNRNILVHFNTDPDQVHDLLASVTESCPFGDISNFDPKAGTFDFRTVVRNYADMIPWVAGFGSSAMVDRTESPELYGKIMENSREALELYGQSL